MRNIRHLELGEFEIKEGQVTKIWVESLVDKKEQGVEEHIVFKVWAEIEE